MHDEVVRLITKFYNEALPRYISWIFSYIYVFPFVFGFNHDRGIGSICNVHKDNEMQDWKLSKRS